MQKQPFIITLGNEDLPNIATSGEGDFGIEFSKTNLWPENFQSQDYLAQICQKLDEITDLLKKIGKD